MKLNSIYLGYKIPEIVNGEYNKDLANRMMAFMRRRKGLGLAANQVAYPYRLFVMDVEVPRRCFNPKILRASSEVNSTIEEGCLSYPGQLQIKPRSKMITVEYINQEGKLVQYELHDLEAICFQHELDHLNGVDWENNDVRQHKEKA